MYNFQIAWFKKIVLQKKEKKKKEINTYNKFD